MFLIGIMIQQQELEESTEKPKQRYRTRNFVTKRLSRVNRRNNRIDTVLKNWKMPIVKVKL